MPSKKDLPISSEYQYGFASDIPSITFPKGINEEVIRKISIAKKEPAYILSFRLKAFSLWKTMQEPSWANVKYPKIDFQSFSYYSAPVTKAKLSSIEEVDPEIRKTMDKLGISLEEQKRLMNVAMDVVFDSSSIGITFQKKIARSRCRFMFDL